ncbi:MAG: mannose-1-phosphate guanylyltransferase, partial [Thermoanaerobaculales bacterium]
MLHVVIMAGGSGTRFWPASRRRRPKQLLALATDTPLLRMTYERVIPLAGRIWVVTTADTVEATRAMLPELPPANVLAEPVGRDTAACAGFAAHALLREDPEAVCCILPADHVIGEEARFRSALSAGADLVTREGGLLTFGIRPTHPETGYGYLEVGSPHSVEGEWRVHRLERFVEKPDAGDAKKYLEVGTFLWNSGMFAWRARDYLEEVHRQLPELAAGLDRLAAALGGAHAQAALADIYPLLPATSVDFGIMEGARCCWTMPVDFPWSDIGSWPALADVLPSDSANNAIRGRVQALDSRNNVLVSSGPTLSVIGIDDLVVVATPDAVLVAPKEEAQRVKEIVKALRERGWEDV